MTMANLHHPNTMTSSPPSLEMLALAALVDTPAGKAAMRAFSEKIWVFVMFGDSVRVTPIAPVARYCQDAHEAMEICDSLARLYPGYHVRSMLLKDKLYRKWRYDHTLPPLMDGVSPHPFLSTERGEEFLSSMVWVGCDIRIGTSSGFDYTNFIVDARSRAEACERMLLRTGAKWELWVVANYTDLAQRLQITYKQASSHAYVDKCDESKLCEALVDCNRTMRVYRLDELLAA